MSYDHSRAKSTKIFIVNLSWLRDGLFYFICSWDKHYLVSYLPLGVELGPKSISHHLNR